VDLGLAGKVAMVAGASRGLGFAIARELAHNGVAVSIASRDEAAIAKAAEQIHVESGAEALGVACDVRSADALAAWHRATIEKFGGLDLLVTNSGGPPAGTFENFDDAAWQNAFDLLVMSALRLARLAIPSMSARGRGSILMLTSSSVKEPVPNLILSNVLRPAVTALAKSLANELAPRHIRVNHLIPGRIATDRLKELDEINSKKAGIPIAEHQRRVFATIPLGRYGQPEEFAHAAVFLLSEAASYITGATLQVDGGLLRGVL
jgi:3-oxoacyl-[acyl-carrier protein] reductase